MATAYRDQASNTSNSATVTLTVPATVVGGDIMLAFVTTSGQVGIVDPSGWTRIDEQDDGSSFSSLLYWRMAQAGEAGTVHTFTLSSGAAVKNAALLMAFSNVNQLAPIHGYSKAAEVGAAALTHNTPALTTTITSRIVQFVGDKATPGAALWTVGATYTKRSEAYTGGSGGVSAAGGDRTVGDAAASNYGNTVWTSDASTATAAMWTLALTPGAQGTQTNGTSFLAELNRLANGGTYRTPTNMKDENLAANEWAGTSNFDCVHALNVKAGNLIGAFKDLQGVCNQLAGTSGFGEAEALRRVVA